MSKNDPYSQDSGVLSTIMGTSLLVGAGAASYAAINDPDGFQSAMTKVFDYIAPMTTRAPTDIQARNMRAHAGIVEGGKFARQAMDASYKDAAARRVAVTGAFDIAPSIDKSVATEALNKFRDSWSRETNLTDFSFFGSKSASPAEEKILKQIHGISREGLNVGGARKSGTSLVIPTVGSSTKDLMLNIPEFDKGLGIWVSKDNDRTLRAHLAEHVHEVGTTPLNPVEHVSKVLSDPLQILYARNSKADPNGYNVRRLKESLSGTGYYSAQSFDAKQKIIDSEWKKLSGGNVTMGNFKTQFTDLHTSDIQDLLHTLTTDNGVYFNSTELEKAQFFGNRGIVDGYTKAINNLPSSQINPASSTSKVTKAEIEDFYGGFLKTINDDGVYRGFTLNQDSTSKAIYSLIEPHTGMAQSEQFKGMSKGIKPHNNVTANRTATRRNATLIKTEAANHITSASALLNENRRVINMLSVFDPSQGGDTMLLADHIADNFLANSTQTITMTGLVGSAKDGTHGFTSRIKSANGSTYDSLHDLFNKTLESGSTLPNTGINFGANTAFGITPGDDIVRGIGDLANARALGESGTIAMTRTRGFMGASEVNAAYTSWLKNMESGGATPIQASVTYIEDAIKISEEATKFRTAIAKMSEGRSDVIKINRIVKTSGMPRLRNAQAEEIKKIAAMRESGDSIGLVKAQNKLKRINGRIETVMSKTSDIDAIQTFDWLKHTFLRGQGASAKIGKNSPEMLATLQHMIAGHVAYKNRDLTVARGTEFYDTFKKISNINNLMGTNGSYSLKEAIHHPEFRFIHGTEFMDEVIHSQRALASIRSGVAYSGGVESDSGMTSVLDEMFSSAHEVGELGSKASTKAINAISGDNAIAYMASYIPNETKSTALGHGGNSFRIGLKEAFMFKDQPELMRELGMYNRVNTEGIMKQGDMMLDAIASGGTNLGSDIPTLLRGKEAELIGERWNQLDDLTNPEVRLNTIFGNKDIAPNGVKIKVTEADGKIGHRYVGSELFGDMQYLGEEDMIARTRTVGAHRDLMQSALNDSNYIASAEATSRYDMNMIDEHSSFSKSGYTRAAAINIEASTYSKNTISEDFLNNDELNRIIKGHSNADVKRFGLIKDSTIIKSKDLYQAELRAKLKPVELLHGDNIVSATADLFGADSPIAKAMAATGSADAAIEKMTRDSIELAKRMTEASAKISKGQITASDINGIKILMDDVMGKADIGLYLRDPALYPHSGLMAFTLASDKLAGGKTLAGGNILRTLMNMDNDGDAIKSHSILRQLTRQESVDRIMGDQLASADLLNELKNNSMAKPLGSWGKVGGNVPRSITVAEANAGNVENAIKSIGEVEGVIAAYMLKSTTGSIDVKTHGLVSNVIKNARENGFTGKDLREIEVFAGTMYPLKMVQESISSKHIARTADDVSSMMKMLENIGGVSGDQFKATLLKNEGAVDSISREIFKHHIRPNATNNQWALDGIEHIDTLIAAQDGVKTIGETQFRGALGWMGMKEANVDSAWADYSAKSTQAAADGATPLFEREGTALARHGYIGIQREAEMSSGREFINIGNAMRTARRNAKKGASDAEIIQTALRSIRASYGERVSNAAEILKGVTLQSKRSIIGLEATMTMVKDHLLNHPTRMAGLAGAAMVGVTAVNMLFGDGAVSDVNELPSVNNPSFRDNRYNSMLENRQLNNVPNANVSSGLLTDSYRSYDSVHGHLQSSFGNRYSSVSVRHDGQDPYKEHMMKYN